MDNSLAPDSSHSKLGLTLEDEEQGIKALSAEQTWQWVVEIPQEVPSHLTAGDGPITTTLFLYHGDSYHLISGGDYNSLLRYCRKNMRNDTLNIRLRGDPKSWISCFSQSAKHREDLNAEQGDSA